MTRIRALTAAFAIAGAATLTGRVSFPAALALTFAAGIAVFILTDLVATAISVARIVHRIRARRRGAA